MLVYYAEPNGIFHFNRYRIYGMNTGHSPTDIPFNMYLQFSQQYKYDRQRPLIDATYREGYLGEKFKKVVSVVAFKYDEIKYLPEATLYRLVHELRLGDYRAKYDKKSCITLIQHALERISPPSYANRNCEKCRTEFTPLEEKQIFCKIRCARNMAQENYSKRVKAIKTSNGTQY